MSGVSVTVAQVKTLLPILLLSFCFGAGPKPQKEFKETYWESAITVVYKHGKVIYPIYNGTSKVEYDYFLHSLVKELRVFRTENGRVAKVEIYTQNGSPYEMSYTQYLYLDDEIKKIGEIILDEKRDAALKRLFN